MSCFKACFGMKERVERPKGNFLYALDFDQTILRADSEAAITAALRSEIPESLISLYDGENWAEFCGILIDFVVRNGVSMTTMAQCIRDLEPLPGMKTLLLRITNTIRRNPKSHFVVISGSNDFFIKTFLEGIRPRIAHTHIISNHAELSTTTPKTLLFTPYENQKECPICPRFLCKGKALQAYITAHGPFTQVYYVGDGCNDVCPAQKLKSSDILFVRENYELERVIRFGFYGGKPIVIKRNSEERKRILYVFDFDKTLVQENSEDIYKEFLSARDTRELVSNEAILNDWTLTCRAILQHLKAGGVSVKQILSRAKLIPFHGGMERLIKKVFTSTITNGRNEVVILSGSNDLLIATLLASLSPPVYPNLIMANHLHFSEEDNYLVFEPFDPIPKECPFCPPLLCKGAALDNYIKEHGPFDLVYYTGDGGNDVCAAVRLREQDVLFVRSGFTLEGAIKAGSYNNQEVKVVAKVIYFTDGKKIEKNMEIFSLKPRRGLFCNNHLNTPLTP